MRKLHRRLTLLGTVVVLLALDVKLFFSQHAATASQSLDITLEPLEIVVQKGDPLPWLRGSTLEISGRDINDIQKYAAENASNSGNMTPRGPLVFVSLGPSPTLGQFVRSALSLRDAGLCHFGVLEGGRDHGAISFSEAGSVPAVGLLVLTMCSGSVSRY